MSSIYARLGKKVKELRERMDLSQQKLAELLNIPRPAVSQIENGTRAVSAEELVGLSRIFGIPIETILELKKEPEVVLSEEKNVQRGKKEQRIRVNVPQENLAKFREVLLYILEKVGSKQNIGETVIYKLLYFIDFDYYEKYEEQLIGAKYQKNHYGPTPIEFAKIVDRMMEKEEIVRVKSKFFGFPQTKYLPLRKPDLSKLTARELETIEDVLNRLSDMTAAQISDYSHNDIPWKTVKEGEIIEYESVFYRTPAYSVRHYPDESRDSVGGNDD